MIHYSENLGSLHLPKLKHNLIPYDPTLSKPNIDQELTMSSHEDTADFFIFVDEDDLAPDDSSQPDVAAQQQPQDVQEGQQPGGASSEVELSTDDGKLNNVEVVYHAMYREVGPAVHVDD